MKKALTVALVTAAMAGGSIATQAYEAGDWILRAGAVTVDPDTDSDAVEVPTLPPLTKGVDVDDNTQLSIIPVYMASEHFGIELLAATPFDHDIDLNLSPVASGSINAGSTKHLPPTLSLQWYPRGGKDGWQPYVGLGVNYTIFFDEDLDKQLTGTLDSVLEPVLGPVRKYDLDLDDSFGLAVQAGVDIPLGDHWAINAGVWYIDIDTTAEVAVTTEGGDRAKVRFDVDIDPLVWNLGIAYKF